MPQNQVGWSKSYPCMPPRESRRLRVPPSIPRQNSYWDNFTFRNFPTVFSHVNVNVKKLPAGSIIYFSLRRCGRSGDGRHAVHLVSPVGSCPLPLSLFIVASSAERAPAARAPGPHHRRRPFKCRPPPHSVTSATSSSAPGSSPFTGEHPDQL